MKNKFLIITMLFLTLFTLTACKSYKPENTDAKKFKDEYESLNGTKRQKDSKIIRSINISENNPMIYKEAKDIVKMINNKETFVVYFGFADCPWCRSVIPTLIDVANDLELDTIYYVDVKQIRDTITIDENNELITSEKGTDDYYELIKLLDNVLSDYTIKDNDGNSVSAQEKRIYAPNIVSVVDGEAKVLESGISDKQTDGYMELTDEMIEETYKKFKCSIECVIENKNICSSKASC